MSKPGDKLIGKSLVSVTGLLILLAILVLVNVLFSFASLRFDATQEKVYSLSDGTRQILSALASPVTLKIFYSDSVEGIPQQVQTYAARVKEFAREYEYNAQGNLIVEIYDPRPDSDEEDWAAKYGVEPMSLPAGEKVYFGMVAVSRDKERAIPFMDVAREELLEYDMTRMIYQLTEEKTPVIGVISTLPVMGTQAQPNLPPQFQPEAQDAWYFIQDLRKTYDVRQIPMTATAVEPDVDLLVVVHPKLPPPVEYLVDQYILAGGNAVILVDPDCMSDETGGGRGRGARASTLAELFKAWKISVNPEKAVADLDQATKIRNQFNVVEDNPAWINVTGDSLSKDDVLTGSLETMLFAIPGAVEKQEGSPLEMTPLVSSSENSALMDAFEAALGARTIHQKFKSGGRRLAIAARLHGLFPAAFPSGPPEGPDEKPVAEAPKNHLAKAQKEATVILVADVDFLSDHYYLQRQNFLGYDMVRMFNDNLNFFQNSCELLTGSEALISIRSRGRFERPFTLVEEMQAKAEKKWLDEEQKLMQSMEDLNEKLRSLESQKEGNDQFILSPEQQAEIEKYRDQKAQTNEELKKVRKNLRAEIEWLGMKIKFVNIFLMALLVSLAGLAFGIYRQRVSRGRG